jgi:hypothetical protein
LGQLDTRRGGREWLWFLISEDIQDGFTSGGLRVVNPFAVPRFPLLEALLEDQAGEGQTS